MLRKLLESQSELGKMEAKINYRKEGKSESLILCSNIHVKYEEKTWQV